MSCAPLGGPRRYTQKGRGVFHLPLARPWTWALTHHGMWSVFVADVEPARAGVPARRHPLHPPEHLLGCWLAFYATREYDSEAVDWLRQAHGLEAPAGDVLPAGCYVAVARLAEVSTVGNDSRAFGRDAWWSPPGTPFCRGTVAWWLEEVQVFEPLQAAAVQRLAPVDPELLPELRERARLARDGLWRPEVYPMPAGLPVATPALEQPPAPAAPPPRRELPADDRPVPPMLHVEQLGLFGDAAPVAPPAPAPPHVERVESALAPPPASPEDLHDAAERLRALLADGTWHPMAEVHGLVGLKRVYRVTCWGGSSRTPDAHQVPVALRGDGQGGCWYAAWPVGARAC